MGVFEEILKKSFDREATKNFPLLSDFILMASTNKSNVDIQITNALEDIDANLLALQEIIESADKEIWAITYTLRDETAIALPQPTEVLIRWLKQNEARKICILLKSMESDYTQTEFYKELFNRLGENAKQQVDIKYTLCTDVADCKFNAIATDSGAFKVKEICDDGKEKVIVNYNDKSSSDQIIEDIRFLFEDSITSKAESDLIQCPVEIVKKARLVCNLETITKAPRSNTFRFVPEALISHFITAQ